MTSAFNFDFDDTTPFTGFDGRDHFLAEAEIETERLGYSDADDRAEAFAAAKSRLVSLSVACQTKTPSAILNQCWERALSTDDAKLVATLLANPSFHAPKRTKIVFGMGQKVVFDQLGKAVSK